MFPTKHTKPSSPYVGKLGHDGIRDKTDNSAHYISSRKRRMCLELGRSVGIVDSGGVFEKGSDECRRKEA